MSVSTPAAPAPAPEKDKGRARQGSSCSDKQIGGAAARGRKITCRFLSSAPSHEVTGYVVGMDDYHWMLACAVPYTERTEGQSPISLVLVHKSRVDLIWLHSEPTLDNEDPEVITALHGVGGTFWNFCENTYAPRR